MNPIITSISVLFCTILFSSSTVFGYAYISPVTNTIRNYAITIGIQSPPGNGGVEFRGDIAALDIASEFARTSYCSTSTFYASSGAGGNHLTSGYFDFQMNFESTIIPKIYPDIENLFFYITAHGALTLSSTNKLLIGNSADGSENYFLTDAELKTYLGYFPDSITKWVIIDACYSGGFINELKSVKNINIITSAPRFGSSYYNDEGIPLLGYALMDFLKREKNGFSFNYLADEMVKFADSKDYSGIRVYEAGFGDPHIFSKEDWNIEVYQSPDTAPVPEPSTMLLLGGGLTGLAFWRRKKTV